MITVMVFLECSAFEMINQLLAQVKVCSVQHYTVQRNQKKRLHNHILLPCHLILTSRWNEEPLSTSSLMLGANGSACVEVLIFFPLAPNQYFVLLESKNATSSDLTVQKCSWKTLQTSEKCDSVTAFWGKFVWEVCSAGIICEEQRIKTAAVNVVAKKSWIAHVKACCLWK